MDKNYFDYIIKQYFDTDNYIIKEGSSGMNNTTKFIVVNDEEYILRIYESHKDRDKINYEHCVLNALGRMENSFKVPAPVVNLKGETIGQTNEDKLISISKKIEGNNPKLKSKEQFYSLGKVVGEITKALSEIKVNMKPIYVSCYELEQSYPKCQLSKVIEFCHNPPVEFTGYEEELLKLKKYFIDFQKLLPKLRELPHQLIHGDINGSNVLEDSKGNISAVLDFEFTAYDLRAMDLAICLSEAISEVGSNIEKFNNMNSFINGYKEYISLTEEEIGVVPVLIMLRRLDVIVHFLVRYYEGISNSFMSAEDILKEQIIKAVNLCKWVNENEESIKLLFI